jgi:uncharacterized protein
VIRLLVVAVEFLFWLLVVRLVVRTFARAFSPPRTSRVAGPASPRQASAPEDLVLDRVCHTYVPRSRALTARVAGREQHFCSDACRERALAAVARAS